MITPPGNDSGDGTRVLVCGYYGYGNAGDEAILSVLLDDLRRVYKDPSITIVTGHPHQVQADHGVDAIDALDVEHVIRSAAAADLMVLGGGGLFQDYSGIGPDTLLLPSQWGLTHYAGFATLGGLVGTPVAIYGVGVGPLDSVDGRRFTAAAFQRAASATVRDHASRDLVLGLGVDPSLVHVTADPAFHLEPGTPPSGIPVGAEASPIVGVSIRPWRDDTWIAPLARSLDTIVGEHHATIVFLPFQTSDRAHEDDRAVSQAIADKMESRDRIRIIEKATPAELLAGMSFCDLLIGMRLHSLVFAATMGTPMVAISYDPKVPNLMLELDLSECVLNMESLDDLATVANRTIVESDRIREHLRSTVPSLRERASRNRESLNIRQPKGRKESARIAADLLRSRLQLWQQVEELTGTLQRTEMELEQVSAKHQAILTSKALAPSRLYWRIREALLRQKDS